MNRKDKRDNATRQDKPVQTCQTCLYRDHSVTYSRDNCFRFARFVDHSLHEASRDCDYWSPAPSRS